nr:MAG TPA: hypothetical protein [Caudoviricetes sp.]
MCIYGREGISRARAKDGRGRRGKKTPAPVVKAAKRHDTL